MGPKDKIKENSGSLAQRDIDAILGVQEEEDEEGKKEDEKEDEK